MKIPTKASILDHLKEARYLLSNVVDKSMDEVHALDELDKVIAHIQDIGARGYSVGE